jgi:hypothetical protein
MNHDLSEYVPKLYSIEKDIHEENSNVEGKDQSPSEGNNYFYVLIIEI